MPYYPDSSGDKAYYRANTGDIRLVADYSRCSFSEVYQMDVFEFWGLLRDAVIWSCSQSDSGREYLENAWYYEQTETDRQGLRAMFGKAGKREDN